MSRNNINFGKQKKSKIATFIKTKVTRIDYIDFNKTLASKEDPYGTKNSIKYFIGTMAMMLLDHYA